MNPLPKKIYLKVFGGFVAGIIIMFCFCFPNTKHKTKDYKKNLQIETITIVNEKNKVIQIYWLSKKDGRIGTYRVNPKDTLKIRPFEDSDYLIIETL